MGTGWQAHSLRCSLYSVRLNRHYPQFCLHIRRAGAPQQGIELFVVCFTAYFEPMLSEKVDTELDTIDASCFAALVNDLCCGTLH